MLSKKNPKINHDKDRFIYFQLGLFVTSASVLMAFSWRAPLNEFDSERIVREAEITELKVMKEKPELIDQPKVVRTQSKPVSAPSPKILTEKIIEVGNKNKDEKNDVKKTVDLSKIKVVIGDELPPELEPVHEWIDQEANLSNWIPYLKSEIKYPEIPLSLGIEGKVWVKFIVEKDGSVSDVKAANKVDKYLEKEAIRVVEQSPKWTPGTLNGEFVRSYKTIVISFALE